MKLTSSVIVAAALGRAPGGVPATHDGHCAYCGLSIQVGDLVTKFFAGAQFTDDLSLACRGSDMTCGHCAVLMSSEALRETAYGAFHSGGVSLFRKWKDIAAALTEPPAAPFVMTFATANNQHMAWRAPVNLSRDLFYVRVGLRDLKIRRPRLLAAVKTAERMGLQVERTSSPKTLAHPFVGLSPDLKDVSAGLLVPKVWTQCAPEDIQEMLSLTVGELWALRFLLSPGAGKTEDA